MTNQPIPPQETLQAYWNVADEWRIYAELTETLDTLRRWSEHIAKNQNNEPYIKGVFHIGVGREPWFAPWHSDGQIDLNIYVEPISTGHDAYRMDLPCVREYHSQEFCPDSVFDIQKHMTMVAKYATRLGAIVVGSHRFSEGRDVYFSPMDWRLHLLDEPNGNIFSDINRALDDSTRRYPDGRK